MSVWFTAVCREKKEIFRPDGWRERHMIADAAQLVALMVGEWEGRAVVMIDDAMDEAQSNEVWDWPNRWVDPNPPAA